MRYTTNFDQPERELATDRVSCLGWFERSDVKSPRRTAGALLDAIRAALEAAAVEFTNGDRPGVRLK